ncbi:MAG: TonB-dependent receptor [Sphingomonadaceae bacterium]
MKVSFSRARLLQAGVVTAILALPGVAAAQGAVEGGAEAGGLQDIVVTARKRAESVQDIPVSIFAMSGERVDRMDLTSIEKISAMTPQFQVSRSAAGSAARLTLRGIGSSSSSIGIEQSVAVVVDGVYYGQGRIINEGFFDLERVEILKGPQALFFGKNATAGVISITTNDPTDELEVMARAGYEFNAQQILGEAHISGPVTETLGFRVAARGSKMFGSLFHNEASDTIYITRDAANGGAATTHISPAGERDVPDERDFLVRGTLKWEPVDSLTATLKASFGRNTTNNPGWNAVPYRCASGVSSVNANAPCGRKFAFYQNDMPATLNDIPYARKDGRLYNKYNSWGVTGTLEYSTDDFTITSVTNYNHNRNRFTFDGDYQSTTSGAGTFATENTKYRAFSSEMRVLTTFDSPVNLLVGGYYQNTKRVFDQWVATGGAENSAAPAGMRHVAFHKNSETSGETASVYGQLVWKLLPTVELASGVRYIHETKDSYFTQPYVAPALAAVFIPGEKLAADQNFSNWSPEATITWKPLDNITVYGAYKTAYKSGGFSNSTTYARATTVDDVAFGPEKASGFEGGIKTRVFDNQLAIDLGVYTYKYTDLQVDFFNAATFSYVTTNAGSARTRGAELQLEYAPRAVDGLNLRGSLNYNKARYIEFIAPCYSGQTTGQGCTIVSANGGRFQDISGAPTAVAPRWTASLGGSYDTPLNDSFSLGLSVDGRYSDSYLPSGFNNPFSEQPSYISIDASVRLMASERNWELALLGKNLTNRFIANGVVDGPGTGSGTGTPSGTPADQIGYISMPRTVQLQLTWRY